MASHFTTTTCCARSATAVVAWYTCKGRLSAIWAITTRRSAGRGIPVKDGLAPSGPSRRAGQRAACWSSCSPWRVPRRRRRFFAVLPSRGRRRPSWERRASRSRCQSFTRVGPLRSPFGGHQLLHVFVTPRYEERHKDASRCCKALTLAPSRPRGSSHCVVRLRISAGSSMRSP